MVDITNTSRAMRGVNTEDQGTVWLQPGQSADLKVSEGEMASLQRVAKDYGLVFGTAQEAREQLAGEDGDGDLGSLDDSGGSTNYEDSTTTDIPQAAATLHPLPADMAPDDPEPVLDTTVIAQPWANPEPSQDSADAGEAGQGSTTGGDDGATATRRSKARG